MFPFPEEVKNEVKGGFALWASFIGMAAVMPGLLATENEKSSATLLFITAAMSTMTIGLVVKKPYLLSPGLLSASMFATLLNTGTSWTQIMSIQLFASLLFVATTCSDRGMSLIEIGIPQVVRKSFGMSAGVFLIAAGARNAQIFERSTITLWATVALGFLVLFHFHPQLRGWSVLLTGVIITTASTLLNGFGTEPLRIALPEFPGLPGLEIPNWQHLGTGIALFALLAGDSIATACVFTDDHNEVKGVSRVSSFCGVFASLIGAPAPVPFFESASARIAGATTGLCSVFGGIFILLSIALLDLVNLVPQSLAAAILMYIGTIIAFASKSDLQTSMQGSDKQLETWCVAFGALAATLYWFSMIAGLLTAMVIHASFYCSQKRSPIQSELWLKLTLGALAAIALIGHLLQIPLVSS